MTYRLTVGSPERSAADCAVAHQRRASVVWPRLNSVFAVSRDSMAVTRHHSGKLRSPVPMRAMVCCTV